MCVAVKAEDFFPLVGKLINQNSSIITFKSLVPLYFIQEAQSSPTVSF
jgi:hypothetical protein